jgi:hypothetical protein
MIFGFLLEENEWLSFGVLMGVKKEPSLSAVESYIKLSN